VKTPKSRSRSGGNSGICSVVGGFKNPKWRGGKKEGGGRERIKSPCTMSVLVLRIDEKGAEPSEKKARKRDQDAHWGKSSANPRGRPAG